MSKFFSTLFEPESKSRMVVFVATPAISILLAAASAFAAEVDIVAPPMAYQLAKQPLALVEGDKCEIRGAVWAGGPRAGVNITLTTANGQVFKSKTNAAGIYAASIPYAGSTLELKEAIADPVIVPTALKDIARIYSPVIVCSKERTTAFLNSVNRSAK